MKLTVLAIALAVSMSANAGPINTATEEPIGYYNGNGKQTDRDRQGDLQTAEFHYPIIAIGYPIYGGYHSHYTRPWHHWHGGYGWRPQYGGQWHGGYPWRPNYGNWGNGQWGGYHNNW